MLIAAVTRTDLVSPRAIGTLFVSDGIDAVEMYPPIYKSKFFVWQTLLSRQAGAPSPTAKLCHGLKAFRKSSSQAEACGSILYLLLYLPIRNFMCHVWHQCSRAPRQKRLRQAGKILFHFIPSCSYWFVAFILIYSDFHLVFQGGTARTHKRPGKLTIGQSDCSSTYMHHMFF